MSTPLDWFVVTSLCWLPLLVGTAGAYGLARMFDALGLIEEERLPKAQQITLIVAKEE